MMSERAAACQPGASFFLPLAASEALSLAHLHTTKKSSHVTKKSSHVKQTLRR